MAQEKEQNPGAKGIKEKKNQALYPAVMHHII